MYMTQLACLFPGSISSKQFLYNVIHAHTSCCLSQQSFRTTLLQLGLMLGACLELLYRYGRSWGAVIDNCVDCQISECRVANFGINGVNVTGGRNFSLRNVEVTGTGQGGVIFEGGNRQTLTPANHSIINCTIHRFARIMQKYCPGVCLTGVGHSMINSSLFDGAHFGMLLTGNDHTIRGNHFHNLVYGAHCSHCNHSGTVPHCCLV